MVYLDEQVVRQLYDAFNQRNFDVVIKIYADNVRLHCPGRNQVSGDYNSRQGVIDFWTKQMEVSEGTFQPKVVTVAESEGHLIVVTDISIQRDGRSFSWRRLLHFTLYDSRVNECWIYEGDQNMADQAFT
jgi:hypothetical protein